MNALDAAKQAIADKDVLYTGQELRNILANLIDYYEKPVTVTLSLPPYEQTR